MRGYFSCHGDSCPYLPVVGAPPFPGPGVDDDGGDRFQDGELGAESQGQEHQEEEERPDLGPRQEGHGLGVDDEGQSGP